MKKEQRRKQINEVGLIYVQGLGDVEIVSPRYLDKELFNHVSIPGIDDLIY